MYITHVDTYVYKYEYIYNIRFVVILYSNKTSPSTYMHTAVTVIHTNAAKKRRMCSVLSLFHPHDDDVNPLCNRWGF